MAALFRRDKPIKPQFVTAPVGSVDLAVEAQVATVDARLRTISEVPAYDRGEGLEWQLDRLLDMRNAIRPGRSPEVPIVPGYDGAIRPASPREAAS
jgi:hypothetical protein